MKWKITGFFVEFEVKEHTREANAYRFCWMRAFWTIAHHYYHLLQNASISLATATNKQPLNTSNHINFQLSWIRINFIITKHVSVELLVTTQEILYRYIVVGHKHSILPLRIISAFAYFVR